MRLLHSLARTHESFDDPNLVSRAGLVPVMALAQRAGLTELVAEQVRPGGPCGVNAQLKVPCLVAGMIGGADSIDDMDLLRHGGNGRAVRRRASAVHAGLAPAESAALGVTFSAGGQRCRSGDIAALLRRQPRSHVRPHNGAGRHCEAAAGHNGWMAPVSSYVTRPLSPDTWDDFARLVEANNGVWGGCWCMGFHPEGVGKGHTVSGNRLAKQAHVRNGTVHQILVYDGDECVGWCQYGPTEELPNINNPKTYAKDLGEMPDWRIGCIFTGSGHRRSGVARAALGAALAAIHDAGGGLVEAYPEQAEGRPPQRGAYFHTGPADLFEEFGFERDRKIAKWRWVMRLRIQS